MVEARAADRAHGPCRNLAPFPPKFKEEWVGRLEKHHAPRTREARTARRRPVWPGTRRTSSCTTWKTPRGVRGLPDGRVALAARVGSAAHSGADSRKCSPRYRFSMYLCRWSGGARRNLAANRGAHVRREAGDRSA